MTPNMITLLLTLPLRAKQDAVLARQRARQIAGLLGFDRRHQIVIAATVFANVWKFKQLHAYGVLRFQLEEDALHIFPVAKLVRAARPGQSHGGQLNARGVRRLMKCLGDLPHFANASLDVRARLPAGPCEHDTADLPWLVRQLSRLAPLDLLDEIQNQNQEIMFLLQEICPARLDTPSPQEQSQAPAA
jgi:hypothetical protein